MCKEYVTTQADCEARIGNKVCGGCGRKVVAIETVDNLNNPTFWSGCKHCLRLTHGVGPKVWEIALQLEKDEFWNSAYSELRNARYRWENGKASVEDVAIHHQNYMKSLCMVVLAVWHAENETKGIGV